MKTDKWKKIEDKLNPKDSGELEQNSLKRERRRTFEWELKKYVETRRINSGSGEKINSKLKK